MHTYPLSYMQSARVCEKALQMHADDMDRAANWLLDQVEKGEEAA